MPRSRSVDHGAAIALLLQGHSCLVTARSLGCRRSTVEWISKRYRADYPALAPTPRVLRPAREPSRIMPRFVRVPDEYRAAGLAEDYRDLVRDFGDVEGARRCRRLLDETRAITALTGAPSRNGGVS